MFDENILGQIQCYIDCKFEYHKLIQETILCIQKTFRLYKNGRVKIFSFHAFLIKVFDKALQICQNVQIYN